MGAPASHTLLIHTPLQNTGRVARHACLSSNTILLDQRALSASDLHLERYACRNRSSSLCTKLTTRGLIQPNLRVMAGAESQATPPRVHPDLDPVNIVLLILHLLLFALGMQT